MTAPRTRAQAPLSGLVATLKQQKNEADFRAYLAGEYGFSVDIENAHTAGRYFNLTPERSREIFKEQKQ